MPLINKKNASLKETFLKILIGEPSLGQITIQVFFESRLLSGEMDKSGFLSFSFSLGFVDSIRLLDSFIFWSFLGFGIRSYVVRIS